MMMSAILMIQMSNQASTKKTQHDKHDALNSNGKEQRGSLLTKVTCSKEESNSKNSEKKQSDKQTHLAQTSVKEITLDEKILQEQELFESENIYAEILVENCISGDLQAVKEILSQGAVINKPNKSGMTPLLGAYWGLNIDVIKYLDTCGVVGMPYEQADQKLREMGKYNVIEKFNEIYSYEQWHEWMSRVEKDMCRARGVLESYTNITDEDGIDSAWFNQRMKPATYKILYITESNHLQYDERKQRLVSRLIECRQQMGDIVERQRVEPRPLISLTSESVRTVSALSFVCHSSGSSNSSSATSSSSLTTMQPTAIANSLNTSVTTSGVIHHVHL